MDQATIARAGSWARSVHTPGSARRGQRDQGAQLAGTQCELHLPSGQPDAEDIGMRWAIAWYRNIQSRAARMGDGHVAA